MERLLDRPGGSAADQILAETILVGPCGTTRLRSRHHHHHRRHRHHTHQSLRHHSSSVHHGHRRRESEEGRGSSQDIIISVESEEYDPQDTQILSQHESRSP